MVGWRRVWAETRRGGAHRQVLVKCAQTNSQVVRREPAASLHVKEVEGRVQLLLVHGQASRAGKALEVVFAQADDGIRSPGGRAAATAAAAGRGGAGSRGHGPRRLWGGLGAFRG